MKKYKLFAWLLTVIFIFQNSFSAPSNINDAKNTYCQIPPFLQQEIYANVMLVIDISGSMGFDVYLGSYNQNYIYKGFFKHDAMYSCYKADKKKYLFAYTCYKNDRYWKIVKEGIKAPYPFSVYENGKLMVSGNWLNYWYSLRMDVIKWALTGGIVVNIKGNQVVKTHSGEYILASDTTSYNPETGQVEGILQKISRLQKKPRIGAYFFSWKGSKAIYYKTPPSFDYSQLIETINKSTHEATTGTGPAMIDTKLYFSQKNGKYGGFLKTDRNYQDPYKFTINNKELVLKCAKNYVILFTDGFWNRPSTGSLDIRDPVRPAYYMWRGGYADLVTDLDGFQNAESYAVALFLDEGRGKNAVKHVAIFGGFQDHDRDGWPCGYKTFPLPNSQAKVVDPSKLSKECRIEWDEDFDGLPDNYAEGSEPDEIKAAIEKIFERILNKISSGTGVSILAEKSKKGAVSIQAIFYPKKKFGTRDVNWIGYLYTYWFLNTRLAQNLREDTNKNKILNITADRILDFSIDIGGNLTIKACSSDSTGRPTKSCTTYSSLDQTTPLWEAGEILKNTKDDVRNIFVPCNAGSGCNPDTNLANFTVSNLNLFKEYLGTNINLFPDCLKNDNRADYEKLINYVRGKDFSGCRKRIVDKNENTWKLGDIIYSTPKIVDYENYSVVYVSSNDGILHAFKLGKVEDILSSTDIAKLTGNNLGKELWGFIPKNALPYLRFLADPNYCHMYINDLSPYIITADYDPARNGEEKILIGGLRLGGACGCFNTASACGALSSENCCINPPSDTCPDPRNTGCIGRSVYFAIDITKPEKPKFLWEFTHQDLGFSYSGPAFIKRKKGSTWQYFIMFASGPTNYKGYSNQSLKLFVLDLKNGDLLLEHPVPSLNNAFGGRLFTDGLDVDEDGQTDYVFLGYTRTTDPNNSDGGIIKIWTGNNDPNNWDIDKQMLNFAKNPITAKIEVGKCFGKWYLFFGTGRYFFKNDDISGVNALYGVPFNCDANNNCISGTINPVHSASSQIACADIGDMTKGSWVIKLDNATGTAYKERNISNPSFTSNIVFFATVQPTSNPCDFGGVSRAWALNCATGEAITSTRCPDYTVKNIPVKYLLQLSGGDVQQYDREDFTEEGGRATVKTSGIASEEGGSPVLPYTSPKGEILLWLER